MPFNWHSAKLLSRRLGLPTVRQGDGPRMTQPTELDRQNAETRRRIADKQNGEYREAQQLALEALGPGYQPWMKLSLLDSDHRRTGDTTPAAVVYKVYRGNKRLSENAVFIRRMPDGTIQHADTYEPLFGDLLNELHPARTIEIGGQQVPVGRWELCWSALERYEPRSPEQLAAARETRAAKAVEKEAAAMPLFSEQILAEGPAKKPRGR